MLRYALLASAVAPAAAFFVAAPPLPRAARRATRLEAVAPLVWAQRTVTVSGQRGCKLITPQIKDAVEAEVSTVQVGLLNLFVQHTSCGLTVNENCDPDVRGDMEKALSRIVPESWNHDGTFVHTMEGDDDMPAHVKSSPFGASLNVPISDGRLALGQWQGVWLAEFRDFGGDRRVVCTVQGRGYGA